MRFPAALPAWVASLLWLLLAVVAVVLAAMVVHALGGFTWDVHVGYFRMLVGVS